MPLTAAGAVSRQQSPTPLLEYGTAPGLPVFELFRDQGSHRSNVDPCKVAGGSMWGRRGPGVWGVR